MKKLEKMNKEELLNTSKILLKAYYALDISILVFITVTIITEITKSDVMINNIAFSILFLISCIVSLYITKKTNEKSKKKK